MATSNIPDIETERLLLREPTSADLDAWVASIWADPGVMRYMPRSTDAPEVRAQGTLDFFTRIREQYQVGAWMVTKKADGQFMGHSMLAYREAFGEPELGYALGKAFWGQGYATEAARAVVHYGIEQANLARIFAVVFPENQPSWRILQQLGFLYEKEVTHYNLPLAYYALQRDHFVPSNAFYRLVPPASSHESV
jgi:[ribosomal protein S5]-alanine N-acetyltransferase